MIDYSGLAANLASVLTPGTTGGGLYGIGGPSGPGFSARNTIGQAVTVAQRPMMSQVLMQRKERARMAAARQEKLDQYEADSMGMGQYAYSQRRAQAKQGLTQGFANTDILGGLGDMSDMNLGSHRRASKLMALSEYRQRLALQQEQFGQDGQMTPVPFNSY
jgi:hypothetical protein